MNILYIGDIMGSPGREVVKRLLPGIKAEFEVDLVVAQAENVSHGKAMTPNHMDELRAAGIDFFTGGNHSYKRPQLYDRLADPASPVIGVANLVGDYPDDGYKIINTSKGDVLICSLLGAVFPEDLEITSPLKRIDEILEKHTSTDLAAIVVNIHSDWSSHKVMTGHYLDGRASMIVGDHWHVPTADARILPKKSCYITDVGMVGVYNSSLGIDFDYTIPRWRDEVNTKQVIAKDPPYQFNALLARGVTRNSATSVKLIQKVLQK